MSSSRRAYKQLQEQQKRLLAQQEELVNLDQGGGGDEAFAMEEDEDDHHRRRWASHSCRIMQAMGQIAKPGRAANIDRRRERRGKDLLEDYFIPNSVYPDFAGWSSFHASRAIFFTWCQSIQAGLELLLFQTTADCERCVVCKHSHRV